MGSFHPFSRLPAELRVQIWEMTVEPRIVDVRVVHKETFAISDDPSSTFLGWTSRLVSGTPVPATLQTCREARNLKLYQQAFSDLRLQPAKNQSKHGQEPGRRYVWVNLNMDIISVGATLLDVFQPVASTIQRLKLERDNSSGYWYWWETRELRHFTSLKEIYIVCIDGMEGWEGRWLCHPWPCGNENVYMIDPHEGRMLKAYEMERQYNQRMIEIWGVP